MSNIIIRGLSKRIHQRLQKLARSQNRSVNQTLLEILQTEIDRMEGRVNEEERRAQVFERVKKLREEIRRKYGKQEDSTKLIREDRDSH